MVEGGWAEEGGGNKGAGAGVQLAWGVCCAEANVGRCGHGARRGNAMTGEEVT